MKIYLKKHNYYCGIAMQGPTMFVSILDFNAAVLVQKEVQATPKALLHVVEPYLMDLVIGLHCSWFWVDEFCDRYGATFVLGRVRNIGREFARTRNYLPAPSEIQWHLST